MFKWIDASIHSLSFTPSPPIIHQENFSKYEFNIFKTVSICVLFFILAHSSNFHCMNISRCLVIYDSLTNICEHYKLSKVYISDLPQLKILQHLSKLVRQILQTPNEYLFVEVKDKILNIKISIAKLNPRKDC